MGRYAALLLLVAVSLATRAPAQDFVSRWLDLATQTQSEQPAWATPLVTSSAKLDQRFRYDAIHSQASTGDLWNFGNNKGIDLVVAPHTEVIIAPPPFLAHDNPKIKDGFGDCSFQLKYRLRSRKEHNGNYIITAWVNAAVPTGSYRNGAVAPVITPTLAAGKGWWNSRVVVQNTLAVGVPVGESARLGYPLQLNTALQYRLRRYLWPQLEQNSTFFYGGTSDGKKQTFLTPALVCGRFPIYKRIGLTVGAGMQIAVTQFHTTNHNLVTTFRSSF